MIERMSDKELKKNLKRWLRHNPREVGIQINDEGFATFEDIVFSFNESQPYELDEKQLKKILDNDNGRIFDVQNNKVRAKKHHTTDVFDYPYHTPSDVLYRLEDKSDVSEYIAEMGLYAIDKKYLQVGTTTEEAENQASQRTINNPVMTVIDAKEAHQNGVEFFEFCGNVYIKSVAARFLSFEDRS